MHLVSTEQPRTTAAILDEYCRYYSDFSKILGIYIKNLYPELHFDFSQLLDASYNVWHRLSDEEKISLSTFLEELSRENNHDELPSPSKIKTFNGLINSEFLANKLNYPPPTTRTTKKSIPLNTSSSLKPISMTPFHIYLKDERPKFLQKHVNMSMRDINQRLSARWQKMSKGMKEKYQYRSYLAKKRFYKKHGTIIQLKKPSFIK